MPGSISHIIIKCGSWYHFPGLRKQNIDDNIPKLSVSGRKKSLFVYIIVEILWVNCGNVKILYTEKLLFRWHFYWSLKPFLRRCYLHVRVFAIVQYVASWWSTWTSWCLTDVFIALWLFTGVRSRRYQMLRDLCRIFRFLTWISLECLWLISKIG